MPALWRCAAAFCVFAVGFDAVFLLLRIALGFAFVRDAELLQDARLRVSRACVAAVFLPRGGVACVCFMAGGSSFIDDRCDMPDIASFFVSIAI